MGGKAPAVESEWIVGWPVIEERGAEGLATVGETRMKAMKGTRRGATSATSQSSFSANRA